MEEYLKKGIADATTGRKPTHIGDYDKDVEYACGYFQGVRTIHSSLQSLNEGTIPGRIPLHNSQWHNFLPSDQSYSYGQMIGRLSTKYPYWKRKCLNHKKKP